MKRLFESTVRSPHTLWLVIPFLHEADSHQLTQPHLTAILLQLSSTVHALAGPPSVGKSPSSTEVTLFGNALIKTYDELSVIIQNITRILKYKI